MAWTYGKTTRPRASESVPTDRWPICDECDRIVPYVLPPYWDGELRICGRCAEKHANQFDRTTEPWPDITTAWFAYSTFTPAQKRRYSAPRKEAA